MLINFMIILVHTKKRNHLQQKTMNDMAFVMANSRLNKKEVRKTNYYSIGDLAFDDEWTIEENVANLTLDASNEDISVEVGVDEDASGGGTAAPMDDLEVPPIANNENEDKWSRLTILLLI